jgi:hypothetical protein
MENNVSFFHVSAVHTSLLISFQGDLVQLKEIPVQGTFELKNKAMDVLVTVSFIYFTSNKVSSRIFGKINMCFYML